MHRWYSILTPPPPPLLTIALKLVAHTLCILATRKMTFSLSKKSKRSTVKSTNLRDLFTSAFSPSAPNDNAQTPPTCNNNNRPVTLGLGEFGQILSPRTAGPLCSGSIPLAGLRARSNSLDLDGWPARSSSSVGYEVKHAKRDSEEPDSRFGYLCGVPIVQSPITPDLPEKSSLPPPGLKSRFLGFRRSAKSRESSVEPFLQEPSEAAWFGGGKSSRQCLTLPIKRKRRGTLVGEAWPADPVRQAGQTFGGGGEAVQDEKALIVVPANSNLAPMSLSFPPLPPTPSIQTPDSLLTQSLFPSPTISEQVVPVPPYLCPAVGHSPLDVEEQEGTRARSSSTTYSSCSTMVAPLHAAVDKTPEDPASSDIAMGSIDDLDLAHQQSMEDMQRAYKRMREISAGCDVSTTASKRSSVTLSSAEIERQHLTFDTLDTALQAVVSENMTSSVSPRMSAIPAEAGRVTKADSKTDMRLEKLQETARAVSSPRRARSKSVRLLSSESVNAGPAYSTPTRSARIIRQSADAPSTLQRSSRVVRVVRPTDSPAKAKATPTRMSAAKSLGLGRPTSTPAPPPSSLNRISSFSYLNVPAGSSPDVEKERQNDMMVVMLLRKLAERDEENRQLRDQVVALEKKVGV